MEAVCTMKSFFTGARICFALAFFAFSPLASHGWHGRCAGGESPYQGAIRDATEELERMERDAGVDNAGWTLPAVVMVVAVAAVFACVFWLVLKFRGMAFFGGTGRCREMALLERLPLGRQSSLLIVRVRGREFFLAEGSWGVRSIAELPAVPSDDAPPGGAGESSPAAERGGASTPVAQGLGNVNTGLTHLRQD